MLHKVMASRLTGSCINENGSLSSRTELKHLVNALVFQVKIVTSVRKFRICSKYHVQMVSRHLEMCINGGQRSARKLFL